MKAAWFADSYLRRVLRVLRGYCGTYWYSEVLTLTRPNGLRRFTCRGEWRGPVGVLLGTLIRYWTGGEEAAGTEGVLKGYSSVLEEW